MQRFTIPSVLITALALGTTFNTGCTGKRRGDADKEAAAGGEGSQVGVDDVDDSLNSKVEGDRARVLVDEDDPQKGASNPLVTIVEYSDFQCPYCSRAAASLDEAAAAYPDDVKLVFKQYPLPMHKDAPLGAQAALAANAQGKFWEMHDKLFENQRAMSREDLEGYAKEIGLDMEKFRKALDEETYKAEVEKEVAEGRKLGVNSTPTFYVNGKLQKGALPAEAIIKLIEEEKKQAEKLIAAGSKREEVYARIMKAAKETVTAEVKEDPKPRPGQPDPAANYAVPTADNRPTAGPEDALVTIVEFSDFQCPFCSRVNETVNKIKAEYPDKVRIVFRQLPLPFHKEAKPAAKASLAAHKQGKFWEMHDKLFANQKELTEDNFAKWAGEIGLDVAQFKKDYAAADLDKMVDEDLKAAGDWGARGTPAFFVNGRFVSGAQPFENFDKVIQEELKKAEAWKKANPNVAGKELYAAMSKGWESEIKQPPIADHKRRDMETKGLPARGNVKSAKVSIVECSDFDCPFCKRAATTVDQIVEEYGDKVAVYMRQYPLPMHKNAEGAHRAALAAGKQGKFWEMHDKLFEDQKARSDEQYEKMAGEIGVDVAKWKKDYADPALKEQIETDKKICSQMDVRGAPGFIINGRLLSGARPFDQFKAVIDEELAGGFEKKAKADKQG